METLKFGDPITNVFAGPNNPHRLSYFVKRKKSTICCTDKKGRFWDTDKNVIYKGHLSQGEVSTILETL